VKTRIETAVVPSRRRATRGGRSAEREPKLSKCHFVGIGGVGVAGLARLYLERGIRVTGTDTSASAALGELATLGAKVSSGHRAEHLPIDADRVVASAAVPDDNPECARARELGIPVEKFSDALAEILNAREGIAVAGTHGKTTVSAWIATMLRRAGLAPGYVIGGRPVDAPSSAASGREPWMVCEACEFDRSFLRLRPRVAVINNVEEDHLDYYADLREIRDAFRAFALGIRPGGVLVAPTVVLDELGLPEGHPVTVLGTGFRPTDRVRAENLDLVDGTCVFTLALGARSFGRVRLSVPGRHNVANALSAAAVGFACGLDPAIVLDALAAFRGVRRRLELVGTRRGAPVLDDYAHHPTEVAASIAAVRDAYPERRLVALFQPHQYSRTRRFLDPFAHELAKADHALVTEIYRAREPRDPALSGAMLAERTREAGGRASFAATLEDARSWANDELRPEDMLLVMGAGNVTEVAHDVVD